MFDLIREIAQTLRNNRTRTVLTGISVAWGILMLIILVSTGQGVVNAFEDHAGGMSSRSMKIWGGRTGVPYGGYQSGRTINLSTDDMKYLAQDKELFASEVSAYVEAGFVVTGPKDTGSGLTGAMPAVIEQAKLEPLTGRSINQQDIRERRKVVYLHRDEALMLFGDEDPVGQYISAGGLAWLVIGTYSHNWNKSHFVPVTTLSDMLPGNPWLSEFTVMLPQVSSVEEADAAEQRIRDVLARAHGFSPDDRSAVFIWNRFRNYVDTLKGLGILQIAIWVIGLLSLVSGIVGVSNIMFVSVRERAHEIGIRRAIGAKPRSILGQVMLESVSITTLFGYIGVVAGMLVMQAAAYMIKGTTVEDGIKDPTVNLSIAISVTVVLIVAGALAGLFPALKATKVKPVEALRDE